MNQNQTLFIVAGIGLAAFVLTRKAQAQAPGSISTPSATKNGAIAGAKQYGYSPAVAVTAGAAQPSLAAGVFGAIKGYLTPTGPQAIKNTATQAGQIGFGWQYFSDGTTISPEGVYYKNGQQVWAPSSSTDSAVSNPANAYAYGYGDNGYAVDPMGNGIY